jgi:hypothetical protein
VIGSAIRVLLWFEVDYQSSDGTDEQTATIARAVARRRQRSRGAGSTTRRCGTGPSERW